MSEEKIKELESRMDELQEKFGKNEEEIKELENRINELEKRVEKNEEELKKQKRDLFEPSRYWPDGSIG